jgi:hypothetical protein
MLFRRCQSSLLQHTVSQITRRSGQKLELNCKRSQRVTLAETRRVAKKIVHEIRGLFSSLLIGGRHCVGSGPAPTCYTKQMLGTSSSRSAPHLLALSVDTLLLLCDVSDKKRAVWSRLGTRSTICSLEISLDALPAIMNSNSAPARSN